MAEPVRTIRWGAEPEFFGPRHEFREQVLAEVVAAWSPADGWLVDAAAGLGSFSRRLAARGYRVAAVDRSWESLLEHRRRARERGLAERTPPVLADVTRLPFATGALAGAVTAETIEHLDDDAALAAELGRVVRPGGGLALSTPADPAQWSDWDVWAEHRRRYRRDDLLDVVRRGGFEPTACRSFGFPLVRVYDALFLRRLIRRRALGEGEARPGGGSPRSPIVRFALRAGRSRLAVAAVVALFRLDRLFEGASLGVGWTVSARRRST